MPALTMEKRLEKTFTKLIRLSPLRLIVGEAVFFLKISNLGNVI